MKPGFTLLETLVAVLILGFLLVGLAGAPVFSHGSSGWGGASFGYILGFLLASVVVGRLAEGGATRGVARTAGVMVLGNVAIYALGVPWLMMSTGLSLPQALAAGVVPFLVGDAIKVVVAAGLLPATWRLTGHR